MGKIDSIPTLKRNMLREGEYISPCNADRKKGGDKGGLKGRRIRRDKPEALA